MPTRLLLFSDLHRNTDAARSLVARSTGVDLAIGAGDFGNLRCHIRDCIEILRELTCPVVLVAGNNESTDQLAKACAGWSSAYVLHGTAVNVAGVALFGLGGGIPTTLFGPWSYDFTEDSAEALLAPCTACDVLVTHSPPWGLVDVSSRGDHLGSRAVRQAVERLQPRLVVCGHIHGSAGQQTRLGSTTIINAGPQGVIWSLE